MRTISQELTISRDSPFFADSPQVTSSLSYPFSILLFSSSKLSSSSFSAGTFSTHSEHFRNSRLSLRINLLSTLRSLLPSLSNPVPFDHLPTRRSLALSVLPQRLELTLHPSSVDSFHPRNRHLWDPVPLRSVLPPSRLLLRLLLRHRLVH